MGNSTRRRQARDHIYRRARERYGAMLTVEDVGLLNDIVRMGLGRPIQDRQHPKGRCGRKLFVTTLDWKRLPVVYDDKIRTIVTILPPDAKEVVRALSRRARAERTDT